VNHGIPICNEVCGIVYLKLRMKEGCWEIPALARSFFSLHIDPVARDLKEKGTRRARGFLPNTWKRWD
jgi:hypothetical protein